MTIHTGHPFLEPEGDRRPARRLRGRLASPVTVWTAADGPQRSGLTVSSVLFADGEPPRLVGLLDEESDLWPVLVGSGRAAVTVLEPGDTAVADVFAGVAPSPGGVFRTGRWTDTEWGPVVSGRSWAGGEVMAEPRRSGWSMLVELDVTAFDIAGTDAGALAYRRGRYVPVPPGG